MFGDRLKELIERRGLSQYAVAKLSGVSKQGLSKLVMGEREPTWETVQRLALALGVDCREFTDPGLAIPEDVEQLPRGRPRKADEAAPAAPAVKGGKGKGKPAKDAGKTKGKGK